METIYTLDARGNVFLESVRDQFRLAPDVMHREIQTLFSEMIDGLERSGVKYADLKSALTPSTDREEIVLLFDSQCTESDWYGRDVLRQVLPLLGDHTSLSVLVGDLIGDNDDQKFIYEQLKVHLAPVRDFTFVHSSLIYCVYLNNLSFLIMSMLQPESADPKRDGVLPAKGPRRVVWAVLPVGTDG